MMTSITKHIVMIVVLVATLSSCNQNRSLQTYFVDNQEKPNFLSIDAPVSILNIDETKLSDEQRDAYKSVQKLNMLAYKKDSINSNGYNTELAKLEAILKDKKYQELMRGGNATDGKFTVKYIGEDDDIDEFIIFGNANDMGFAVVRILGDDMDPNKLMTLTSVLEKSNINDTQINQVMDFFK